MAETATIEFKRGIFTDAKLIREKVFMEEQGFANEFDEVDANPKTIHITAYVDGKLAGCSRVFPSELESGLEAAEGKWIFGRLAVLPEMRKGGLGSKILHTSEQAAKEKGATEMHLHAQCNVQSFYRRNGYEEYGPIEFDEHVEHQWMSKEM